MRRSASASRSTRKSPGGVIATARRTESFRPLVEDAVADSGFDADLVEAIVFLESGGRPDVIAGDDPAGGFGPDADPGRDGTELPRDGRRPG